MDQESVENVSSKQRAQKFSLIDRPSCREAIENAIKRRSKGTIDRLAVKRYREAVEIA